MDYVNGDDVTGNAHLAEAIDVTREGSAQPGLLATMNRTMQGRE